jgi:3-keto-5-aminohexanoate cleavage enzyme
MEKLIITAAATGSLPAKKRTPHVPITPAEIVGAEVRYEQAGAAVIHVHARIGLEDNIYFRKGELAP